MNLRFLTRSPRSVLMTNDLPLPRTLEILPLDSHRLDLGSWRTTSSPTLSLASLKVFSVIRSYADDVAGMDVLSRLPKSHWAGLSPLSRGIFRHSRRLSLKVFQLSDLSRRCFIDLT
eukprot:TRINITY_DN871_c0_g2_i6.p2 TRINITY_DN871_c0_g2~~TRINITY_DN871_c0_g2_i6.p2  ORF type:complete len:117 (+),score=2.87 TRINITY_DN871_c0_g2_i6:1006-1356(+)